MCPAALPGKQLPRVIHFDCNQPQPGRAGPVSLWHCDQLASVVGLLESGVSSNPTATRTSLPAPEPNWRDRRLTECRFSPILSSGSPPRHTQRRWLRAKSTSNQLGTSLVSGKRSTSLQPYRLVSTFNSPKVAWKGMQSKPGYVGLCSSQPPPLAVDGEASRVGEE